MNSSAAPVRLHAQVVVSVSKQAWFAQDCVTAVVAVTNLSRM